VKVHDEEGVVWQNLFASFIFLAFDPTITTSEFSSEAVRDVGDVPSVRYSKKDMGGWIGVMWKRSEVE
jgi:hypothetical protein